MEHIIIICLQTSDSIFFKCNYNYRSTFSKTSLANTWWCKIMGVAKFSSQISGSQVRTEYRNQYFKLSIIKRTVCNYWNYQYLSLFYRGYLPALFPHGNKFCTQFRLSKLSPDVLSASIMENLLLTGSERICHKSKILALLIKKVLTSSGTASSSSFKAILKLETQPLVICHLISVFKSELCQFLFVSSLANLSTNTLQSVILF